MKMLKQPPRTINGSKGRNFPTQTFQPNEPNHTWLCDLRARIRRGEIERGTIAKLINMALDNLRKKGVNIE